eukprot:3398969-Prymnesium_polylepis.1
MTLPVAGALAVDVAVVVFCAVVMIFGLRSAVLGASDDGNHTRGACGREQVGLRVTLEECCAALSIAPRLKPYLCARVWLAGCCYVLKPESSAPLRCCLQTTRVEAEPFDGVGQKFHT